LSNIGLTIAKRALLGHYCHIFTFVVGLEQCKNMGRQPNYEPFIVPVAAIPEIDSHKNFDSYSSRGTGILPVRLQILPVRLQILPVRLQIKIA
jgi:hypothetical protein